MQTIFLLSKVGSGKNQKTFFNRQGVAFNPNRDGSINFKLDMFPGLTFQLREQTSDADEGTDGN